jgi:hypothetical protein
MQVQHRFCLILPELDQLAVAFKREDKIEWTRSAKMDGALAFDMASIRHIKNGDTGTLALLDIKERPAIRPLLQQHRLAGLLGQFRKILRRHKDEVAQGVSEGHRSRNGSTCDASDYQSVQAPRSAAFLILIYFQSPQSHR